MKRILVMYATREGQTRRIAEHIGVALREHGWEADILNVVPLPEEFTLMKYDAAILAASVHMGRHEAEMVSFVKSHRSELEQLWTAFLSVSSSEATAEDDKASSTARERSAENVKTAIDTFLRDTGWQPAHVLPVAGAMMYKDYGPLLQFLIRWIAKRSGATVDTARNTEYTDWEALDQFVDEFAEEVPANTEKNGDVATALR